MSLKRVSASPISGFAVGIEWVSQEEVEDMEDEDSVDHDEYGCPCLIVDLLFIRVLFIFERDDA
jgi:hypothetical protein